jgi:hypothetical protein
MLMMFESLVIINSARGSGQTNSASVSGLFLSLLKTSVARGLMVCSRDPSLRLKDGSGQDDGVG